MTDEVKAPQGEGEAGEQNISVEAEKTSSVPRTESKATLKLKADQNIRCVLFELEGINTAKLAARGLSDEANCVGQARILCDQILALGKPAVSPTPPSTSDGFENPERGIRAGNQPKSSSSPDVSALAREAAEKWFKEEWDALAKADENLKEGESTDSWAVDLERREDALAALITETFKGQKQ